ncbi:MAG: SUMF1/EgtB/PvdO family nonheme iron enzyme [Proteobacteria bacterium]|nr:SUMF1/EgtB/PvdO family nonheme iron enzyme [Pseudomonadota bacterium]
MRKSLLFLILSLFLSFPVLARENTGDLAVMEIFFTGKELTNQQLGFLADDIREKAVEVTNFRVMSKDNILAILKDKKINLSSGGDPECDVEYGRILQADKLITSQIVNSAGACYLKLKLYDIKTANLDKSVSRETPSCDFGNLRRAVLDGVQDLLGGVVRVGEFKPGTVLARVAETLRVQPQGLGTLEINTQPDKCRIFIDSEDCGLSPRIIESIPAGERTVVLTRDGYVNSTEVVRIEKGKRVVLNKTLSPQTGSVLVSLSNPAFEQEKASVYLDGKYIGVLPREGRILKIGNILTGQHALRVDHPDYEPIEENIEIRHNATEQANLELKGKPGRILIASTPASAAVYLNGVQRGETPFSGNLIPGRHRLRVSLPRYNPTEQDIEIKPNRPLSVSLELEALPPGQKSYERAGMIFIPAGEFMMGCNEAYDHQCENDEKPYHRLYLDAYYIDKYETTVGEYEMCVGAGKCGKPDQGGYCNWKKEDREDHPVNCVDWYQADAYCHWKGERLPTEAEWEKAARGTQGLIYPWGNEFDCEKNEEDGTRLRVLSVLGGNDRDRYQDTAPVTCFISGVSPYGIFDLAGNVWEWVRDWYGDKYYQGSPARNPQGPPLGNLRGIRGGSWYNSIPTNFRASNRNSQDPLNRRAYTGFRCAR